MLLQPFVLFVIKKYIYRAFATNVIHFIFTINFLLLFNMKKVIFPFLFCASLQLTAQKSSTWLQLPPIGLEKPALHTLTNVDSKSFGESQFLTTSSLNMNMFEPEQGKGWINAQFIADTLKITNDKHVSQLCYSATYLACDQWVSGTLEFTLFGDTELYIDDKLQYTQYVNGKYTGKLRHEFTPGKHLIVVKSIVKNEKLFALQFVPDTSFKDANVSLTSSPLRGKNIYDILNGNKINTTSLSASGKYALIGITNIEDGNPIYTTSIYDVYTKEILYSFMEGASSIKWLPQSDKVTFLRKQGNSYSLFCYDPIQKKLNTIFKNDTQINNITWAPDESYIIYSKNSDYEEKNWQLKKLEAIQDRQPGFRTRTLLHKYDLSSGLHTQLSWGNLSTYLMDISTDASKLLISTSRPNYSTYPFIDQDIYMVDAYTFAVDTLFSNQKYAFECQFSPNGKQLLITGGASSFGKLGENILKGQLPNQYDKQLFIYDLQSQQAQSLTKSFHPSVEQATWHDNGTIYFTAVDGEYVRLYRYENEKIDAISTSGDMFLSMSFAKKNNNLLYTSSDIQYPPRIYTMHLDQPQSNQLWMDPTKEQYENIIFGEVHDWDYKYNKNTVINGRYYLPHQFDPTKKYPMIVYYYGGTTPVGRNFGGRWPFNMYAAMGYVVYVLQPSGTIGYGQEFAARHQNNWGKITGDEIIKSVKAFTAAHSFVDKSRIGCMGASYGGFTTMYLTTQTDIFTCAISHAGISSISSYWGDGYWGYGYSTNASGHSYPWNRRDIYVDQSPLFRADKVNCPILLIHGTKDVNVPTSESIQFYTALRLLNKESDLVLVKDADHAVVDYQQRILWSNTIMAYFAKYLKNQPAWWNNIYPKRNL